MLTVLDCAQLCSSDEGFDARFQIEKDEKLYGLGDVTRDRLQKHGYKTRMWVTNVTSYTPIPFLMSNRGWAVLLNTTFEHFIDVGADDLERLRFYAPEGGFFCMIFGQMRNTSAEGPFNIHRLKIAEVHCL